MKSIQALAGNQYINILSETPHPMYNESISTNDTVGNAERFQAICEPVVCLSESSLALVQLFCLSYHKIEGA
jgi:hypothetical protein